jgi:hypothetical protein
MIARRRRVGVLQPDVPEYLVDKEGIVSSALCRTIPFILCAPETIGTSDKRFRKAKEEEGSE